MFAKKEKVLPAPPVNDDSDNDIEEMEQAPLDESKGGDDVQSTSPRLNDADPDEETFNILDPKGNGFISIEAFHSFLTMTRDPSAKLSESDFDAIMSFVDTNGDEKIQKEEFVAWLALVGDKHRPLAERLNRAIEKALNSLEGKLRAIRFSALFEEKCALHLRGTREWVFKEILGWINNTADDVSKLFWLMGAGGTGKTVVSAEFLRRLRLSFSGPKSLGGRHAAHHFFRHDNKITSDPCALLRSLAAQMCKTIPGFKNALVRHVKLEEALVSQKTAEVFDICIKAPLQLVNDTRSPDEPIM
eukprot:g2303.t1